MAVEASLHPVLLPPIAPRRRRLNDDHEDNDADASVIRGWDHSIIDTDLPNNDDNDDDDDDDDQRQNRHSHSATTTAALATSRTATFHALAHGHTVVGTTSSSLPTAEDSILWQTSLNHHRRDDDGSSANTNGGAAAVVTAVASNADGSVIAATTQTTVSLLKGCDGSILATRQIANDRDDDRSHRYGSRGSAKRNSSSSAPQVLFLSSDDQSSSSGDILVVVCPVVGADNKNNNVNNPPSNVILISNINGKLLNSNSIQKVREGAAMMKMEALPLESSFRNVTWMEGDFVNSNTIRFFINHHHPTNTKIEENASSLLSVVDYNVTQKKSNVVLKDLGDHLVAKGLGSSDENADDHNNICGSSVVGMGIDDKSPTLGTFLLIACSSNTTSVTRMKAIATTTSDTTTAINSNAKCVTEIAWVNILDLSISAKYTLPSDDTSILSCAAIQSHDPETCLAAALACKNCSRGIEIRVVQSMMISNKVQEMEGNTSHQQGESKDAMLLFTIDVDSTNTTVDSVDMCAPTANDRMEAYAFRFLTIGKPNNSFWEFAANKQQKIGILHALLAQHSFDKAHALTEQIAMAPRSSNGGGKISTSMDKSLVSLMQFRHVLSQDVTAEENKVEARKCLRRLTSHVIASRGGEREVEIMIEAATFLLGWPQNQAVRVASGGRGESTVATTRMVSMQGISMALSAMSTAIQSVVDVVGLAAAKTKLQEQKCKLDDRCMALNSLKSILGNDLLNESYDNISLDDPYLAVESTVGLLHFLVAQGAFKSIERLQTCEIGEKKQLSSSPGVMASAALRIPLNVDPLSFVPWLCDVVIPSLSIGYPLLGHVRSWACNAADHYDEENILCGIDSSIMLLTAVSKATARLTVGMDRCFSYPMELLEVDNDDCNDQPITPRNNNSVFSFGASFDSQASLRSTRPTRPTVLNIGMTSGIERKDGRIMSAQRVSRSVASNNTSLDFSFFSPSSSSPISIEASFIEEETDSVEHDCVEYKLNEALRLKKARDLGMERDSLTLAMYSSKGEQYIVKELVKSALLNRSELAGIVTYAADVDASFDNAVHQYANELCDSSRDNIPHVMELTKALATYCSSPSVKCLIVLKMLRRALVSVQQPPNLTPLAMEAISMAADDNLKSELEEATRLLAIDSLVRKYVGNGAQEFFRVSDPSHGLRLVQHVCRHIDMPTVLADALVLCDAFTNISKLDTCVSLLQRAMVAPAKTKEEQDRACLCASFMREIYSNDIILAERAGERMAGFCAGILEDCRKMIIQEAFPGEAKQQAMVASSTACSILSVMQDQATGSKKVRNSIAVAPKMLKEFQKISKLQSGCGIFLTIEELRDPPSCASVVSDLLKPCVEVLFSRKSAVKLDDDSLRNELKPLVATARQWCAILCDIPSNVSQLWSRAVGSAASQVAKASTNHGSLLLLDVSGLLDERDGRSSFHSIMSVVLSLCASAFSEARRLSRSSMTFVSQDETDLMASFSAMKSMAQASLLIREHILLYSPSCMLSSSLSLGLLTELICEISTRSDMGYGEQIERYIGMLQTESRKHRQHSYLPHRSGGGQGRDEPLSRMLTDKRLPSTPVLHPTWYIGDGLLLQPLEALFLSMSYCKFILDIESMRLDTEPANQLMEKSEIIHSLESRGAHTTSLRLLQLSTATSMSQDSSPSSACLMFPNAQNIVKKNNCVLAERSLGGTESGLTSGNIDGLLSLSFLLHLPKEMAFKIYQAALPSAIGKRDYSRILTLASIGAYCGVGVFSSGESFPWSKQRRFIDQCDELTCNATWWGILSQYGVGFDPSVFSKSSDSKSPAERTMQSYCVKLVWTACKTLGPRSTLMIARRFMKAYGLNKHVPQSSLIEFLLSAPTDDVANSGCSESNSGEPQTKNQLSDIRHDLIQTEAAVRECLALLPTLNRTLVLRKCVMTLEKDPRCAKDYDRHAMALQIYRECLNKLSGVMKKSDARAKAHEEETERIERRLQSIIIISSIFEKYQSEKKPEYIKLFEPLPRDPSIPVRDVRKFSVLGIDAAENVFDPLAPLDGVLEDENGSNSIVAALAPLCSLLLLPSGYLHARSLVVRFRKLKALGGVLPLFDSSVVPVAKKLKTSRDRADLAWWCSLQYDAGSVEQLKCLEMSHANATEASEEAETSKDSEEEKVALERAKRVDVARAGLSDKILVDEVLRRNQSMSRTVKVLYKLIIDKVHKRAQSEENYRPENLVQALLIEGSLAAAVASLDDADGFSAHHFRLLALLVHDACKALSNRYSHVNVGKCARLLTRRWLVHGDDSEGGFTADLRDGNTSNESQKNAIKQKTTKEKTDVECEFVMDMDIISDQNWSNDSGTNNENNHGSGITSSEEPSALKSLSSLRESSNHICSRVALRIAFLICFAEDYHNHTDASPEKGILSKRSKMRSRSKPARKSHQCFEGDLALQHARELLCIVFARQGSTVASTCDFLFGENSAYDDSILSNLPENSAKEDFHSKSKALSFAMRHRALRVATILCPQEVIARVVLEETFSGDVGDDHLNKCAFGSFVAMEVEAMGLPLPHSDLVQLSVMHFPSYARTIWRNHGGSSSRGFSGRLLLLLLELGVNHHDTVDWELFVLIFSELKRLELPRSLLLACECAIQSSAVSLAASQKRLDVLRIVADATRKITELIVSEVETNVGAGIEFNVLESSSTLHRLVTVINTDNIISDPTWFVQASIDLSNQCRVRGLKPMGSEFMKAAIRITNHITDPDIFCNASSIISSTADGRVAIGESMSYERRDACQQKSVYNEAIHDFERSFC